MSLQCAVGERGVDIFKVVLGNERSGFRLKGGESQGKGTGRSGANCASSGTLHLPHALFTDGDTEVESLYGLLSEASGSPGSSHLCPGGL